MRIHGLRNMPGYLSWLSMNRRCSIPGDQDYATYGGRGISVCERWRGIEGLKNFIADMGAKPSPKHSIDRIDNNGNYEPGNCRWATVEEQCRNRSNTRLITFNGKTQCMTDWAAELKISRGTIFHRIRRGWTVSDALTTPAVPSPRKKSD